MENHIQFMNAFLSGLRSLPNPDEYTRAYIRAFEVCLHSAKRNQQKSKGGIQDETSLELPIDA